MNIALAMSVFFLVCFLVYVFIAIFVPEWVGITGRKAKSVLHEHREEPPLDSQASTQNSSEERTAGS
jgi:hypothetical protein